MLRILTHVAQQIQAVTCLYLATVIRLSAVKELVCRDQRRTALAYLTFLLLFLVFKPERLKPRGLTGM
jgi:hypothetical protein